MTHHSRSATRTGALALLCLFVHLHAEAAPEPDESNRLIDHVATSFVSAASRHWSDFSVCEHRSRKTDNSTFLRRSFGERLFPKMARATSKELRVSEEGAPSGLHLGLIAVMFGTPKEAADVYAQLSAPGAQYLKNTKILTRYKALLHGNIVLIVFSETFLHKTLQEFFSSVTLPP